MHQSTKQSGMVLILAILIIAAVLGAAVSFSNLIIREIRQSRLIDQSIQAYYLAESGSEKALYQVRRQEAVIACPAGSSCDQTFGRCSPPYAEIPCIVSSGNLEILGSWQIAADNESDVSIMLKRGGSFQVDLFNSLESAQSDINTVKVNSDVGSPMLEGEFINLTKVLGVSGFSSCENQPPVFKEELAAGTYIEALDGQSISNECSYSFKLKHLLPSGQPFGVFTISIYNSTPSGSRTQRKIPSRLFIDSQASFGLSLQKIRVRTATRPPLSGLYDFVLFSEEEIVK